MLTKEIIQSKERNGHRNLFLRRLFNKLHGGGKKEMRDKNKSPIPFAIRLREVGSLAKQIFLGPVLFNEHYFRRNFNFRKYQNAIKDRDVDPKIYEEILLLQDLRNYQYKLTRIHDRNSYL